MAGCLGPTVPPLASSLRGLSEATGYHYPAPVSTDDQGNPIPIVPWLKDPNEAPVGVLQVVPGELSDPMIAVTEEPTRLLVAGLERVMASSDHGASWAVANDFVSPDLPQKPDAYMTGETGAAHDAATHRTWVSRYDVGVYVADNFRAGACDALAWSDDGGVTWTNSTMEAAPASCAQPWSEAGREGQHKLVANAPVLGDPLMPSPRSYPDNLYECGLTAGLLNCAVSVDGGQTYLYETFFDGLLRLNCAVATMGQPVGYEDGAVAVPFGPVADFLYSGGILSASRCPLTGRAVVATSVDNARSWTLHAFEGANVTQQEPEPGLAVDSGDVSYLVVRNGRDGRAALLRSPDRFQTWQGPYQVSPRNHTLDALATVTAGDRGRIAIGYAGTRTPQRGGATAANATGGALWHYYFTTSLDAASDHPTFYTVQASPDEAPINLGCIATQPAGSAFAALAGDWHNCVNQLSHFSIAHDGEGRFYGALTASCSHRDGCIGDPAGAYQARDRQAMVAVEDSGVSLFEGRGPPKALGLALPPPVPHDCCAREGNATTGPARIHARADPAPILRVGTTLLAMDAIRRPPHDPAL